MDTRLPGFKGEYLWEFDIADRQLSAFGGGLRRRALRMAFCRNRSISE